jgi:tetratricopeptide (TPR) repeat protein
MTGLSRALILLLAISVATPAQEMHDHGIPEKLGSVSFPISCDPAVQQQFNRGVALLHSFAYVAAEQAFQSVAVRDPRCAMAHWGIAMTFFHPVWSPSLPPDRFAKGQTEMLAAARLGATSSRERQFIRALGALYQVDDSLKPSQRTLAYEQAMADVARENDKDVEAQVFYALALLSNAPPTDKTHAKQKAAIAILEPLFREHPNHPGIAHYLIHACDSEELAQRGLLAARTYAQIAPTVPHALHMPSHIFTRLGLWNDSIQSNLAAIRAAREQGDVMQELHAMDYLVYAYLQTGRDQEADQIVREMQAMPDLDMSDVVIAYAATAMPIREAVERGRWADAARIALPKGAPVSVVAIAIWSRALGLARTGHPAEARVEADRLRQVATQLGASGDDYGAMQTGVLASEVMAWSAQASGDPKEALSLLTAAADTEDRMEKLPVTPGPILPAREQLGDLLLQQNRPDLARKAFQTALADAPGRWGALQGVAHSEQLIHSTQSQ